MARLSDIATPPLAVPLACALALVGGLVAAPACAQASVSQPVVQPTPSAKLGDLNDALKQLARDPGNMAALLRAGWDSLAIDDTQSALGFFRRAAALQPQNGDVKAGLAAVSLHLDDPVNAVRLFAEAEAAGTPMGRYAGDRGLALDLVGNNVAAQRLYLQALALNSDPEIVRRLALSQAIAGDQNASEATLLPLLQRRDLAAYRTRAFALAILGLGEEAVSIAQTMLPPDIANRLAPYLRYMPRLTRAQQAAAANLGQFPPAAEIGRDSPQIAAFSASAEPKVATAAPDSRLVPSGQPLGPTSRKATASRGDSRAERTRKGKGTVEVTYSPLPQPPAAPPPQPAAVPPPQPASTVAQAQPSGPRVPAAQQSAPQVADAQPSGPRVAAAVEPSAYQAPENKPVLVASLEPPPSSAPPPPPVEEAPRPSLSISAPPPEDKLASLAETFADFAKPPPAEAKPTGEAVDISRIKPAREATKSEEPKAKPEEPKAKPKAKPKPPASPSRIWVQVGTGRDMKAQAFTWRRLQREAGALLAKHEPYSAKWGATRRLLTGPYKSEDDAQDAIKSLKKKGIDAFEFTSDEGEDVAPLK